MNELVSLLKNIFYLDYRLLTRYLQSINLLPSYAGDDYQAWLLAYCDDFPDHLLAAFPDDLPAVTNKILVELRSLYSKVLKSPILLASTETNIDAEYQQLCKSFSKILNDLLDSIGDRSIRFMVRCGLVTATEAPAWSELRRRSGVEFLLEWFAAKYSTTERVEFLRMVTKEGAAMLEVRRVSSPGRTTLETRILDIQQRMANLQKEIKSLPEDDKKEVELVKAWLGLKATVAGLEKIRNS